MPDVNSLPGITDDWAGLIDSSVKNAELLAGAEPLWNELIGILDGLKVKRGLQKNLEGNRQELAQQIKADVDRGRETARKLRAFIKSRLGSKSERLPQFGIAPIRKRTRKATPPETQPPETPTEGKTAKPSAPASGEKDGSPGDHHGG